MEELPDSAIKRVQSLREYIQELRGQSFGEQYGLADFTEDDVAIKEKLDSLAKETEAYKKMLDRIDDLIGPEREEDDGKPF